MAYPLNNKNDVQVFIESHLVSYKFRSQPQLFLPSSALDTITTRDVIRKLIELDTKVVVNNEEQKQLVDKIYRHGRKIFATCVYCDKSMAHVRAMLDNGLTDKRLPLRKTDFESLSQKGGFVNSFIATQKHFHTVFFGEDEFEELNEDLADRFSIPINFEESKAHFRGRGAFGDVYQVTIHSDQRSFPCVRIRQWHSLQFTYAL
jgi:hypothetical protein